MASALHRSTWLRFMWVSSAFTITGIALIKGEERTVVVSDLAMCIIGVVLVFRLTHRWVTGLAAAMVLAVFARAFGHGLALPVGACLTVALVPATFWLQRHWVVDAQAMRLLDGWGLPKQPMARAQAWFLGGENQIPLLDQLLLRGEVEIETLARIGVLLKEELTEPEREQLERARRALE
jgi:hypothetical protein